MAPGEHACAVKGCADHRVPAKYLMCRRHWMMLARADRSQFSDLCYELTIAAAIGAEDAISDAGARVAVLVDELCAKAQRQAQA